MGGSARPSRRRAASGALRYARPAGRGRGGAQGAGARRRDGGAFGCLVLLAATAVIVLIGLLIIRWGDDTWQWAARVWPGGVYGFAVSTGLAAPCLAALSLWSLTRKEHWSRQGHRVRATVHAVSSALTAAALLPFPPLALSALHGSRSMRRSSLTSWVSVNYPWAWAVGLASTAAGTALLVCLAALLVRRGGTAAESGPGSGAAGAG